MKTILLFLALAALAAISCKAAPADKINVVLGGDTFSIPVSDHMELDLTMPLAPGKKGKASPGAVGWKYQFTVKGNFVEVEETEASYSGPSKSPSILVEKHSYRIERGTSLQLVSGLVMRYAGMGLADSM